MVNHRLCKMRISKKNEVYLLLEDLQPSEQQELAEYFTFEVPGAKFMPMYRNRMRDGKIRLFSPASGEIWKLFNWPYPEIGLLLLALLLAVSHW